MPIFGSSRATSKPGVSDSTTNAEMPEWPALGIGLREDRVHVRHRGVGDEALRAVEDVLVAVPASGRSHRGGVRARACLGERIGGEPLARGETGQEALLLLVAARELDRERAELLHREDQPARRADLRDLLDRDQREQRPRARSPVLLVEEEPEDAVLAEELDDVPGELVRRVDLGRARCDSLPRDRPHEVADLELVVGQLLPGHPKEVYGCGFWQTASMLLPSASWTNAP